MKNVTFVTLFDHLPCDEPRGLSPCNRKRQTEMEMVILKPNHLMNLPLPSPLHFWKSMLILLSYILSTTASGQISHGGKPLPLEITSGMRSLSDSRELFVEMPSISNEAELWRSAQEESGFKSLHFAHKFHRFLRPDNAGITFQWANMKVWRVGIRSKGAYSLNILFSSFRLPPGARVFVFNGDQTEILGSFTEENNSELNLLPVQPIGGDELIVEYQEPLDARFPGEIEIGEVNHDFRGIFRATEPRDPTQDCHPNIVCYPDDILPGSGVVGLIINGTTYCTGSLTNNTAEDGTPYLLTATHCLNNDYDAQFLTNRKYDMIAGTIVAFFHYQSPLCSTDIRGPLQMTLASADSVLISERHDISLLRFKDTPPAAYQPYYLGWDATTTPRGAFHGVHHPNGGIKKVAIEEGSLSITSFPGTKYNIEPNAHWAVNGWDTGATEGGSSGSPLLESNKRIVGTLTGGVSMCTSPRGPDQYASLSRFWNVEGSIDNPNPIHHYLDPAATQAMQLGGYQPHADNPYTRSMNFGSDEKPVETLYQSVPMFATNNAFGYAEFAEEYHSGETVLLEGVFISSPAISNMLNNEIRIRIYTGEEMPTQLIYEQPYSYSYRYYGSNNFSFASRNMNYSVENYISFDTPVSLSGTFYISYYDANGTTEGFTVFNAEPRPIGSGKVSTTWIRSSKGWERSSENIENPMNTSLLISPYVIGDKNVSVRPAVREDPEILAYYSKEVNRILIESDNELLEWELFYVSGQKIRQGRADKSINRTSLPAAQLPKGVYIVRVKTVDGTQTARKVLVQ